MKVKKILLGLFVIGASIISVSNAGYTRQIGVRGYQPYDQSFNVEITKNGTFLSETMGVTKKIFIIDGSTAYFWNAQTGVPYFIGDMGNGGKMEGLINKYLVCDEIITDKPTNCSYREVNNNTKQLIGTFLTNVTNEDNLYFDKGKYCANGSNCRTRCSYVNLCISSNNLGQSICFEVDSKPRGNSGPTCDHQDMLTGGRNLYSYGNDVFSNIPSTFLENPPSVGMNTGNTNNTQTTYYNCPTIQQLINNYGEKYNINLCYSDNKIWNGSNFENVTQQTLFEMYPQYDELKEDIDLYNNYCNNYVTTQNACIQAFTGRELKGTYIMNLVRNEINPKTIYGYCNLQLNYPDKNITTCVGSGIIQPGTSGQNQRNVPITNKDIIDAISNNNYTTIVPGNTTIIISGNQQTTEGNSIWTDIVENEETTRDIIGSIQSIYSKITGIFEKREGRSGIIPDYIIRILLLIVLFKIFKK